MLGSTQAAKDGGQTQQFDDPRTIEAMPSLWEDPKTIIAAVGTMFGICGFGFAIFSFQRNRHESRLDSLGKVIQPMVRAVQHFNKANNARQKRERLMTSFPDAKSAREATERAKTLLEDHSEAIKEAEEELRLTESEFVARSFRFPDKIAKQCGKAVLAMVGFGKAVNKGDFEAADLEQARFKDELNSLRSMARGMRLSDPFEWIKIRTRKHKIKDEDLRPFELDEKQLRTINEMIEKRANSQGRNTFAVHPPKKLIERPEIASSERILEELGDSPFYVVFQDGTGYLITLGEMLFFTAQLIRLASEIKFIEALMEKTPSPGVETKFQLNVRYNMNEIMSPETAKLLLSKIEFSEIASDDLR